MESGEDEPPLPPEMGHVLSQMTQILNHIQQNQEQGNEGNNRVTVLEFLQLNPRTFDAPSEPLDADDWLREMSNALDVSHVSVEDRVPYVTFLLRGKSMSWWENFQESRAPGVVTTWDDFKEAFKRHHIPDGVMERKREEFYNLTQGSKSVLDYERTFNLLARYARDEVSTDAQKQDKFRRGLNPAVKYALTLFKCNTYEELVNLALREELGCEMFEESRKHALEVASSSANSRPSQKHRVWIPYATPSQPTYIPRPTGFTYRPPAIMFSTRDSQAQQREIDRKSVV